MNPLDLFLEGGKAIKIIFKIGFIPKEEDFEEFSESDYEKYHKEVGETEGKMFRFVQGKMDETEYVFAFDEFEKETKTMVQKNMNVITRSTSLHCDMMYK